MALRPDDIRGMIASDPDLEEIFNSSIGSRKVYEDTLRALGRVPTVIIDTASSNQVVPFTEATQQHFMFAEGGNNVETWQPSPTRK